MDEILANLSNDDKKYWTVLHRNLIDSVQIYKTNCKSKKDFYNLSEAERLVINQTCRDFNNWKNIYKFMLFNLVPEANKVIRICHHCSTAYNITLVLEITLMHTYHQATHFICIKDLETCRLISIKNSRNIITWYGNLDKYNRDGWCNYRISKIINDYVSNATHRRAEIGFRQCAMAIVNTYALYLNYTQNYVIPYPRNIT